MFPETGCWEVAGQRCSGKDGKTLAVIGKNCFPSVLRENVIILLEGVRSCLTLHTFNVLCRAVDMSYLQI